MPAANVGALVKPFSTLLVSARGEIACRIIRTARRLGLRTVAVYSDADVNSLHVRSADAAHRIGGPAPTDSYLHVQRILDAAEASGAGAIHPGYGFLSENAHFAQACNERELVFVGPPAHVISAMGSKSAARQLVSEAGVPIIPGYHRSDQSDAALTKAADEIGYPVMVKPVMGGGGKGMYVVRHRKDMQAALVVARHEAKSSFGDDSLLLEKFIALSRHVEVQVFGDSHGNVVHLYERDCSTQRRHQKIIEEAPAPMLSPSMRSAMHLAAVATAKQVGYVGAGTVEFIVDTSVKTANISDAQPFYFLEMNTRLQVEHPVTEAITGIDLVEWQLVVAAGNPMPVSSQAEIKSSGSAIEARIYAECPEIGFMPQTGTFRALEFGSERVPEHLKSTCMRVDSGVEAPRDTASVYYDPLVAKVVCFGPDRESARQRLNHALTTSTSFGVRNNIEFCSRILNIEDFIEGGFDTGMLPRYEDDLLRSEIDINESASIAGLGLLFQETDRIRICGESAIALNAKSLAGFRVNSLPNTKIRLRSIVDDREWFVCLERNENEFASCSVLRREGEDDVHSKSEMRVLEIRKEERRPGVVLMIIQIGSSADREKATVTLNDNDIVVHRSRFSQYPGDLNGRFRITKAVSDAVKRADSRDGGLMANSPMPGTIVRFLVSEGQKVLEGDVLFEVEAMKMMHSVKAGINGVVFKCNAKSGDLVDTDAVIVELKKEMSSEKEPS